MGNRAVITKVNNDNPNYEYANGDQVGIYLHWNGGYDSVNAFLTYCKLKGFRGVETDESYAWARLTQVIANFFGGGLSVGIDILKHLDCDNYDNGVYLINDKWEIVDRRYYEGEEQDEYDLLEMLTEIDSRQPTSEQLGAEQIKQALNKDGE